jgi:hypothetical protein
VCQWEEMMCCCRRVLIWVEYMFWSSGVSWWSKGAGRVLVVEYASGSR